MKIDPKLIGDGALVFWKALRQVFGATREQRCWVYTANVLNKLPKHLQPKAKSDLHQIWMAATREQAYVAVDALVESDKDGTPFPIDRTTYDRTIETLHRSLNRTKIDRAEKIRALHRLADFAGQHHVAMRKRRVLTETGDSS